ncbi:MAG: tyrosine-type recombinase/integrase [Puniceicoccales bacterium]
MARPKKEQRFSIVQVENRSNTNSYRVQGYKPNGERVRKNFKYRADAVEYLAALEAEFSGREIQYSLMRTTMSEAQLRDAEQALKYAGNKSLTELVLRLTDLGNSLYDKPGISLEQAVTFAQSHYRTEIEEITIHAARDLFLGTRTAITTNTLEHYRNVTKPLIDSNPNHKVHEISVRDLNRLLSKYTNANSRRTFQAGFGIFFNWAMRNHYCLENPCERLDKPPALRTQIEVLRLGSVKRLMKAASVLHEGAMASSVAILLFAGLRPSELSELEPQEIRKDVIRVKGGKLRREINRSVPIPPVLGAWLKNFPYQGQPKGWRYKFRKLKEASGAENWVNDILRHTSISYQLERDKDEAQTAFHCGTSPKMINRHYRDVIDEADDIFEFWNLTPEKVHSLKLDSNFNQRGLTNWPPDAKLKQLVWEKPLSRLAKDMGVSDNAIRKRCKKLGIDLPKNGHWQRVRAGS